MSKEFSCKTMLSVVKEALEDGSRTLEAIQTDKTNSDPWIIGRYQATEALEKFDDDDNLLDNTDLTGVFGSISYVRNYELIELGQVETDLCEPEDLASMVAYLNMEYVLNDLSNALGIGWHEKLTDKQVDEIKKYIDKQVK